MNKTKDIINILTKNKQEHIINLYNNMNEEEKQNLENQINNLDLAQIMELYQNTKKKFEIKNNKIEAIEYVDKYKLPEHEKERLENIGADIIKNNQYAVITMAGGQGTRLEHNGPKGTFKLDVYGKESICLIYYVKI